MASSDTFSDHLVASTVRLQVSVASRTLRSRQQGRGRHAGRDVEHGLRLREHEHFRIDHLFTDKKSWAELRRSDVLDVPFLDEFTDHAPLMLDVGT